MTQESKNILKYWLIGLVWFYILLWPFLGVQGGELSFENTTKVWSYVGLASLLCVGVYLLKRNGSLGVVTGPLGQTVAQVQGAVSRLPLWATLVPVMIAAMIMPFFATRYVLDVSINVLIYVCLGLGLNIVVGLAGLLDLGYIAFYGVGAYTYALLNVHFGLSFWLCLPLSAGFAAIAGCFIGYPTLRMRGDYLAIVTLGFGEIIRIILNNWMDLTNGPNGVLGVKSPGVYWPNAENGYALEHMFIRNLSGLYYIILALAVVTVIAVYRLNFSRIGRAWEAIREDETAAEVMGVNTFNLKLLAYAMGALFGGIAGAFFAARMRSVSPESFTFIESAMVLAMVVLGGMGSIPGIILGALALIALPEAFREVEAYRMLAFGLAMTVMMLFRPKGLIPAKRVGGRSEEKE